MPEAAVHKYRLAPGGKDDVRTAGQIAAVDSEAIACAVQQRAERFFRLLILATNNGAYSRCVELGRGHPYAPQTEFLGGSSAFRCRMRSKISEAVEVNQMVGRICKPVFCFPTYVEDPASEFLPGSENASKDFWKRASGGEFLKSEVTELGDGIGGVDCLNQEEPLVLRVQPRISGSISCAISSNPRLFQSLRVNVKILFGRIHDV